MKHFSKGPSSRVAIIGAGAAGLVSARECLRRGLKVKVFEQSGRVGGVWIYQDEVEDDLLGLNPSRHLHGSLYASLRTNLPRKLMAFRDFPFEVAEGVSQFVSHALVQDYLERFADHFDLHPFIRYNSTVESVQPIDTGKWKVKVVGKREEVFDAVMICNGHYSNPRVPALPCMDRFKGQLLHSHNYRTPGAFRGKRVALLGAAASALDISVEISPVAEKVFWCAQEHTDLDLEISICRCGTPKSFTVDGIELTNGQAIAALDAFIFCTGYHYRFPFLEPGIVKVVDNWVHPLYLELIPPTHPTMAFPGLPYSIIPFPLFEIQAKWFTRYLAGWFELPSREVMLEWSDDHRRKLKASGRKQRNYHKMGSGQYGYMNKLALDCGAGILPDWFAPLAEAVRLSRLAHPVTYRDRPLDDSASPWND